MMKLYADHSSPEYCGPSVNHLTALRHGQSSKNEHADAPHAPVKDVELALSLSTG